MKAEFIRPQAFSPSISDKFFIDTNVWLYLIFPHHSRISKQIVHQYSRLFDAILKKECLIETSVVQIAEIVNLIIKLEYRVLNSKGVYANLKAFRSEPECNEALKNAQTLIRTIITTSKIRSGNFDSKELLSLALNIEKADFNDLCYARHCEKENAILVTHDFDFKALNSSLKVISANESYY